MTDDPANEADLGQTSIRDKLRYLLANAATLSTQILAVFGLIVSVGLILWMTWEQLEFLTAEEKLAPYKKAKAAASERMFGHTQTTAERNFLCNEHVFDMELDENLNDKQVIVRQIYELKEVARQHAIPFDPIGRIGHFFRCSVISDITTTSVAFDAVLAKQTNLSLNGEALVLYERSHQEFVKRHFEDVVPDTVLEIWGASVTTLEQLIAPQTDPETESSEDGVPTVALALGNTADKDAGNQWLLIVGSDATPLSAFSEVNRLRTALRQTLPFSEAEGQDVSVSFAAGEDVETAVSVFRTGGRLRTVAAFKSRQDADFARRVLQSAGLIRLDAYTRNVASWCDGNFSKNTDATTLFDAVVATSSGVIVYDCS